MSQTQDKALVVIDVQKEYVTDGRPFRIQSIESSLQQAAKLLAHARAQGWPVIHVRHLQAGQIFNPESNYSEFIDGFEPSSSETYAVKSNFSSFSSEEFERFAETHRDKELVVIGYGATMCCMATLIDGYNRGFRMAFAQDASAAKTAGGLSEESLHQYATTILATFSRVTTTQALVVEG